MVVSLQKHQQAPAIPLNYRTQSLDDSSLVGYERGEAYTTDYSFTTLTSPSISGVSTSDLSLNSAVVSWSTNSLSTATIHYGKTTAYGSILNVNTSASESSHSARLSNLDHSTTYHFSVKGTTVDGDEIASDDYTFKTVTFPKVTATVFNTDQSSSGTTIVMAWATNIATTGEVQYQALEPDMEQIKNSKSKIKNLLTTLSGGKEGVDLKKLQALTPSELGEVPAIPKGKVLTAYSGKMETKHIEYISGLDDGSLYVFTIRGRDEYGNEAIGEPVRYLTGADTRAPVIKNVIIETPITGVGSEAKSQIIISWETDEPALGQILWGQGTGNEYPQSTEKEESYSTKHVMVMRDLEPTSSYHLKIVSIDSSNNKSESKDTVVVTPTAQQAAFDIILKNLEDVFGFLKL
jgi:hypothetical protein